MKTKLKPITTLGNDYMLAGLVLVAVCLYALTGLPNFLFAPTTSTTDSAALAESRLTTAPAPDINLVASAALIWDERTDSVLYEKNATIALPIASITKVLTAIAAARTLPADSLITITNEDLNIEGTSGLLLGDTWNRDELIGYMLTVSSNDGAHALARTSATAAAISIADLLNQTAADIGLNNYRFTNATGLDTIDGVKSANDASAVDVVVLMKHLRDNYPQLAETSRDANRVYNSSLKTYQAKTTNQLASTLPHIDAAKTGFTYTAGGNLTLVADIGLARPVYFVVLGSTIEGRFSDMEKLYYLAEDLITHN